MTVENKEDKRTSNLISLADRSEEEKKEIATKGALASAEVRREKKRFKDLLEIALSMKSSEGKNAKKNDYLIVMSMIKQAKKGSVEAFKAIRDTIGEKPTDKVENETEIKGDLTGLKIEIINTNKN